MADNPNHSPSETIMVTASDMPVSCPRAGTTTWDLHPKVYIPLHQENPSACPYCGTIYQLKTTTDSD